MNEKKYNRNKKNQKGITLIALIITIIVILILVAVTVSTVANSGLFDHAKNAAGQWAQKQDEESNISIDDDIKKYVGDDSYYVYGEPEGIGLFSKENDEPTTFEEAYIEYQGQRIKITESVRSSEGGDYKYIRSVSLSFELKNNGYINERGDIWNTEEKFTFVKNGIEYTGMALIYWEE